MEKRKILKSKKFLAVIAIALMLCLIGGMGAMTYSKYVTSKESGSQSATAAKWGYVISINSDELFGTDYAKLNANNKATVVPGGNGVAVKATGDANVIAPGTSGSIKIEISGSAQVLAKLKINANLNSKISYNDYEPVKWTITGDGISDQNNIFTNEKDYEFTKTLNAYENAKTLTYCISWEWEFENNNNNNNDTLIGYKANGTSYENLPANIKNNVNKSDYDGIVTELSLELFATVEQIQENNN